MDDFTQRIISFIKSIPYGRVTTYGTIAACAGNSKGARTVAWILHSCSTTENLPWYRVVGKNGVILLSEGPAFEEQKALLCSEGVVVIGKKINLSQFGYYP